MDKNMQVDIGSGNLYAIFEDGKFEIWSKCDVDAPSPSGRGRGRGRQATSRRFGKAQSAAIAQAILQHRPTEIELMQLLAVAGPLCKHIIPAMAAVGTRKLTLTRCSEMSAAQVRNLAGAMQTLQLESLALATDDGLGAPLLELCAALSTTLRELHLTSYRDEAATKFLEALFNAQPQQPCALRLITFSAVLPLDELALRDLKDNCTNSTRARTILVGFSRHPPRILID